MKPKPQENKNKQNKSKRQQIIRPPQTPKDVALILIKRAVAQICKSVGLKKAQLSALETLTHITTLYMETLAQFTASYANASNRTQSNVFDIMNALQDVGLGRGFVGGSSLHVSDYVDNCNGTSSSSCLVGSSSVLEDLGRFANSMNEVPFSKPTPEIGAVVSTKLSSMVESCRSRADHIPRWLPEFPEEGMIADCGNGTRTPLWENHVDCSPELVVVIGKEAVVGAGDLVRKRAERVRFEIGGLEKRRRKARRCIVFCKEVDDDV